MGKIKECCMDIIERALLTAGINDDNGQITLLILNDPERYPVDSCLKDHGCNDVDMRVLIARLVEDFAQCNKCRSKPVAQVSSKWYCAECWKAEFMNGGK